MLGIFLAIHVLTTVLLIFVVLIQKSEGGSSLFASGAGNGMFTARGTSDILTKSTWVLATIFLCNCIFMAHISAKEIKEKNSIIVNSKLQKSVGNSKKKKSVNQSQKQPTKANLSTEKLTPNNSKEGVRTKHQKSEKTKTEDQK